MPTDVNNATLFQPFELEIPRFITQSDLAKS